jgi:preprotein translocase subunit SecB
MAKGDDKKNEPKAAGPVAGSSPAPAPGSAQAPIEATVVSQYIKDLSFENPNVRHLVEGPGDEPSLNLEVNVNGQRMGPELYESVINLKAHATNKKGVIYDLEVIYGGLFKIKNLPEQAAEPFLLINCPTLLFPFLRRIAADITREGGYPPLLLDPMDFGGLYVQRQRELAQRESKGQSKN